MKTIPCAALALILAVAGRGVTAAQSPPYGPHPAPPPRSDDYREGPGGDDPRYDDRDGDGRRYDDRGRGDERWRYDAEPSPRFDVGFFYDELSPYGDWVLTRAYGWAWFPRDVRPYWRPYLEGRWVNTDYGWTWASYEPFGWATYHYGRWAWDNRFGWLWVPGTIWGPAWVSWQYGGGYVGWAPLPPAVGFRIGFGFRFGNFDFRIGIQPDAYTFVPERAFLETRLSSYRIPTARNLTLFRSTRNVTDYGYDDDRVVNRGITVERIEQVTGRRAQRHHVTETGRRSGTEVTGREVRLYRPERRLLDAVRIGPQVNEGLPPVLPNAGREVVAPSTDPRDPRVLVVAPRAGHVSPPSAREIERRDRREQLALERYQASEKVRIERLQKQEISRVRVRADREAVEKNHQAERAALQHEQQEAAKQLAARQKLQREAALAKPPVRVAPPAANKDADEAKGKDKDKKEEKDKKDKDHQGSGGRGDRP